MSGAAWVQVPQGEAEALVWLVRHWRRSVTGEPGVGYAVYQGQALRMTPDEDGTLRWMEARALGVMN